MPDGVGHEQPMRVSGQWARETVQRFADDVVVAAAPFKPNAAGVCDLSPCGFAQRALLKSRGAYLAERLVIGVTPLHVHAVRLAFGGRLVQPVARWARDQIDVVPVVSHRRPADPAWPALRVTRCRGLILAEVQPLQRDSDAECVVDLLLTRRSLAGLVG